MFVYSIVLIGLAVCPALSSAVRDLATILTCRGSEFTCLDGTCISAGAVCDTHWDCPDGSDEASCYSSTHSNLTGATVSRERHKRQSQCGLYQWRCTDGTCIAVGGKCDGKTDCPDRSDETHGLCRNIKRSTVSGKCVLPPYPEHGTYVAINAPDATPGQSFEYAQLKITCEQGYGMVGDALSYCLDGTWLRPIQECVAFCRLDPDVSVQYNCWDPGTNSYRICNQFELSGTLVNPECNAPIYGSRDSLLSMTCRSDGKWNRIIRCKPECGRVTPFAEGLIWGGKEAIRGELPWHVAIYKKPTQINNYYEQICGGSIVSNRIVISAAHCFWDNGKEEKHPASNYAVATAKLFREWDHKDDKNAQKSEIKSIEVTPYYRGVRTNFQHDIAVLILETPFVYYTYVRPVCLDLIDLKFNKLQLQAGNFGKVAGWGLTEENGPASPVLKVVQLPFVPIAECIRITPQTFTESITGDKICAGYNDGTAAVCRGDSGGGLSFPETERGTTRYYLRGVVSTSPRPKGSQKCNVFTVTTFTEIYQHKDFINQFMSTACTLPPYPENGFYEVDGDPAAKPGDDAENVYLNVTCNHGHNVIGNNVVQCILGEWSTKMPQCVRARSHVHLASQLQSALESGSAQFLTTGITHLLNKSEGAACEWNGDKGKCVKKTQCLTTLDTSAEHPNCSKKGDEFMVCCTDCELVNDTRNVVIAPNSHIFWKDGTKARDSCLEYLEKLPYRCREGGFNYRIRKNYDEEGKCHTIGVLGNVSAPTESKSAAEYPHQALLGYGDDLASAKWLAAGSIISNKYILTTASASNFIRSYGDLKFVALGVEKRSDGPTAWQTHNVKRFIRHPDFNKVTSSNDIALIETETPITFNKDVLPACLHVTEADAETAIVTRWNNLKANSGLADKIQTKKNYKFTEEECKNAYPSDLEEEINYNTQMCYGSKTDSRAGCKAGTGEPLLITTQFSPCIYTIIGVTSFEDPDCPYKTRTRVPNGFSRVAYYKPWIESIVWA